MGCGLPVQKFKKVKRLRVVTNRRRQSLVSLMINYSAMQSVEKKNKWQNVISLESINNLSVEERLEMIDAIEQTLGEEYWEKLDVDPEEVNVTDIEPGDVLLAQESLEEYKKNPQSGVSWDEFYKDETARLSKPK